MFDVVEDHHAPSSILIKEEEENIDFHAMMALMIKVRNHNPTPLAGLTNQFSIRAQGEENPSSIKRKTVTPEQTQ